MSLDKSVTYMFRLYQKTTNNGINLNVKTLQRFHISYAYVIHLDFNIYFEQIIGSVK